jgi:hypothetical protein
MDVLLTLLIIPVDQAVASGRCIGIAGEKGDE